MTENDMLVIVDSVWQYIVAAVAAVVWLIRLENKTGEAHRRLDEAEEQKQKDIKQWERQRLEDNTALQTFRNELNAQLREIRDDMRRYFDKVSK